MRNIGAARGMPMVGIDVYDLEAVAKAFGIACALAAEIAYENDECYAAEEDRWASMRRWAETQLRSSAPTNAIGGRK